MAWDFSQDIESEVAAAFGPLVVLLGQGGSDEPMMEPQSGKKPTTAVRRQISL